MPKKVLVVEHYLKGDFNNALAIAQAVADKYGNGTVDVLSSHLRSNILLPVLKCVIRWGRSRPHSRRLLSLLGRVFFTRMPEKNADYCAVVSTLGRGEATSAYLSMLLDIPAIHLGGTKRLPVSCFALVFAHPGYTPQAGEAELDLPPTRLNRNEAQQAATAFLGDSREDVFYTLLIGGDAPGISYSQGYWQALFLFMEQYAHDHGGKWLVSTSPRTPPAVVQQLQTFAEQHARYIQDMTLFGLTQHNNFLAYIGAGNPVFVTAESVSMIADALSAGQTVVALTPQMLDGNPRVQNFLQEQARKGHLQLLDVQGAGSDIAIHLQDNALLDWKSGLWQQLAAKGMTFDEKS